MARQRPRGQDREVRRVKDSRRSREEATFAGAGVASKIGAMRKTQPLQPAASREKVLMTIDEAVAYSGWTKFKVRTLCISGELRTSHEGHAYLITREAIRDCIVLVEGKSRAKREARLALKLARKMRLETGNPAKQAHESPCVVPGCLICASEKGRQRALELKLNKS